MRKPDYGLPRSNSKSKALPNVPKPNESSVTSIFYFSSVYLACEPVYDARC